MLSVFLIAAITQLPLNLECRLKLESPISTYEDAIVILQVRNTTKAPIRISDTITPGRGVSLHLLRPASSLAPVSYHTNVPGMSHLDFSYLSPGQTKTWRLRWSRCFLDVTKPQQVLVTAMYDVGPFLTMPDKGYDIRFASTALSLLVEKGKVRQSVDPVTETANDLRLCPGWSQWYGRRDATYDKMMATLERIARFDTPTILRGIEVYLNKTDRALASQASLLYVLGQHLFNVPPAPSALIGPEGSVVTRSCAYDRQPLAFTRDGRPVLVYRMGMTRGPGYHYRSSFKSLEKEFGRRPLP